jgi:hypothetical protein
MQDRASGSDSKVTPASPSGTKNIQDDKREG